MKVIISPSKTMVECVKCDRTLSLPTNVKETKEIMNRLKGLSEEDIRQLMKINDRLAKLNKNRYESLKFDTSGNPAILSYDGLQYKNMQINKFTEDEITFLDNHIRIISGLYGVLRPLNSIYPYRLEMQSKLRIGDATCLYDFWNSIIYKTLEKETDTIVNLASNEYSKIIKPFIHKDMNFITCVFKVKKADKLKVESTASKIARGQMIYYIIKNKIVRAKDIKVFNQDGYSFMEELSTKEEYVFVK
jgi:cytoplasmic iron level regulating protein YaaA (DUF328/UPF0246 family)